jgi:uncharacterized protein (DUF1778 family)
MNKEKTKINTEEEFGADLRDTDEKLVLSSVDRDRVMAMLDNPPEPNENLRNLFR